MEIKELISPPRSPWCNGYVERVIGSIRRDCLDHHIVLNEKHLHKILNDYLEYYHHDRTHLGLDKDPPINRPITSKPNSTSKLVELPRCGGLHHRYEWQKAA